MNYNYLRHAVQTAGLLLLMGTASAHEGHETATFMHGFTHPFGGVDHLIAMLVVGLLAARQKNYWRFVLPLGFIGGLALGGLLGAFHIGVPAVEMSIAISILLFGVLLSLGTTVSPWALLFIMVIAAMPHGHAHLTEAASGTVLTYGVGMLFGSAVLHAGGIFAGLGIQQLVIMRDRWQLIAGPVVACMGAILSCMVAFT